LVPIAWCQKHGTSALREATAARIAPSHHCCTHAIIASACTDSPMHRLASCCTPVDLSSNRCQLWGAGKVRCRGHNTSRRDAGKSPLQTLTGALCACARVPLTHFSLVVYRPCVDGTPAPDRPVGGWVVALAWLPWCLRAPWLLGGNGLATAGYKQLDGDQASTVSLQNTHHASAHRTCVVPWPA
jgi:hypothetical protein